MASTFRSAHASAAEQQQHGRSNSVSQRRDLLARLAQPMERLVEPPDRHFTLGPEKARIIRNYSAVEDPHLALYWARQQMLLEQEPKRQQQRKNDVECSTKQKREGRRKLRMLREAEAARLREIEEKMHADKKAPQSQQLGEGGSSAQASASTLSVVPQHTVPHKYFFVIPQPPAPNEDNSNNNNNVCVVPKAAPKRRPSRVTAAAPPPAKRPEEKMAVQELTAQAQEEAEKPPKAAAIPIAKEEAVIDPEPATTQEQQAEENALRSCEDAEALQREALEALEGESRFQLVFWCLDGVSECRWQQMSTEEHKEKIALERCAVVIEFDVIETNQRAHLLATERSRWLAVVQLAQASLAWHRAASTFAAREKEMRQAIAEQSAGEWRNLITEHKLTSPRAASFAHNPGSFKAYADDEFEKDSDGG